MNCLYATTSWPECKISYIYIFINKPEQREKEIKKSNLWDIVQRYQHIDICANNNILRNK